MLTAVAAAAPAASGVQYFFLHIKPSLMCAFQFEYIFKLRDRAKAIEQKRQHAKVTMYEPCESQMQIYRD